MSRSSTSMLTAARLALLALARSPLRSALTAFGVLVGVSALTIVVALGEGASKAIQGFLDSLGTSSIEIRPEQNPASGAVGTRQRAFLTEDDARAIAREAPNVTYTAPLLDAFSQVASEAANVATSVRGTTLDFFRIREWPMAEGELWNADAERGHERVCVLGHTTREELFGLEVAVGRTIRIGPHPFRVIGVLGQKGQSLQGSDMDDVVMIPLGTLRAKVLPTRPGRVHRIFVGADDPEVTARAESQATGILRQRHGLAEGAANDFRVRSLDELRRTQEEILGVVRILLLCVAAVSLVVGGIGVMNIMLVSVAERRQEIGVRLALGATARAILSQFLVEAVVLTVLGGLSGALVAAGAMLGLESLVGFPVHLSPAALAVALASSSMVGLVFGYVPARGAALLEPTEAMRRD